MAQNDELHLTDLDIRGESVPVTVSKTGMFHATVAGRAEGGQTLDILRENLMKASKRSAVKVTIPFTNLEGPKVRTGVVTGRHQGTHNILVLWAPSNKREELTGYSSRNKFYRPFTAQEITEYQSLYQESERARAALRAFEEARVLDVSKMLNEAEKAAEQQS